MSQVETVVWVTEQEAELSCGTPPATGLLNFVDTFAFICVKMKLKIPKPAVNLWQKNTPSSRLPSLITAVLHFASEATAHTICFISFFPSWSFIYVTCNFNKGSSSHGVVLAKLTDEIVFVKLMTNRVRAIPFLMYTLNQATGFYYTRLVTWPLIDDVTLFVVVSFLHLWHFQMSTLFIRWMFNTLNS